MVQSRLVMAVNVLAVTHRKATHPAVPCATVLRNLILQGAVKPLCGARAVGLGAGDCHPVLSSTHNGMQHRRDPRAPLRAAPSAHHALRRNFLPTMGFSQAPHEEARSKPLEREKETAGSGALDFLHTDSPERAGVCVQMLHDCAGVPEGMLVQVCVSMFNCEKT